MVVVSPGTRLRRRRRRSISLAGCLLGSDNSLYLFKWLGWPRLAGCGGAASALVGFYSVAFTWCPRARRVTDVRRRSPPARSSLPRAGTVFVIKCCSSVTVCAAAGSVTRGELPGPPRQPGAPEASNIVVTLNLSSEGRRYIETIQRFGRVFPGDREWCQGKTLVAWHLSGYAV